jgi:hypothetical protein
VKTATQAGSGDLAKVAAKPRAESDTTSAVFAKPGQAANFAKAAKFEASPPKADYNRSVSLRVDH